MKDYEFLIFRITSDQIGNSVVARQRGFTHEDALVRFGESKDGSLLSRDPEDLFFVVRSGPCNEPGRMFRYEPPIEPRGQAVLWASA